MSSYVDSKRRKKREEQVEVEEEMLKKRNPQARDLMKDLLKEVSQMSGQDWINIPEYIGKGKGKSKKEDKYTPLPDMMLSDRLKASTLAGALDASIPLSRTQGGVQSIMPGQLSALSDARRTILGLSLDHIPAGSILKPALDKTGYMTALGATSKLPADIHDLKKARLLFKSMVESDPTSVKGWQGAARIEEMDGKFEEARNIIAQGVQACPHSEDVWAEAVRLEPTDNQQALVTQAVKACPKSGKLWLLAANIEKSNDRKIKIYKMALQSLPQNEKIWKELVSLAPSDADAKEWLLSAVECVPVDLYNIG